MSETPGYVPDQIEPNDNDQSQNNSKPTKSGGVTRRQFLAGAAASVGAAALASCATPESGSGELPNIVTATATFESQPQVTEATPTVESIETESFAEKGERAFQNLESVRNNPEYRVIMTTNDPDIDVLFDPVRYQQEAIRKEMAISAGNASLSPEFVGIAFSDAEDEKYGTTVTFGSSNKLIKRPYFKQAEPTVLLDTWSQINETNTFFEDPQPDNIEIYSRLPDSVIETVREEAVTDLAGRFIDRYPNQDEVVVDPQILELEDTPENELLKKYVNVHELVHSYDMYANPDIMKNFDETTRAKLYTARMDCQRESIRILSNYTPVSDVSLEVGRAQSLTLNETSNPHSSEYSIYNLSGYSNEHMGKVIDEEMFASLQYQDKALFDEITRDVVSYADQQLEQNPELNHQSLVRQKLIKQCTSERFMDLPPKFRKTVFATVATTEVEMFSEMTSLAVMARLGELDDKMSPEDREKLANTAYGKYASLLLETQGY